MPFELILEHSIDAFVSGGRRHFRIPLLVFDGRHKLICFSNCRMDTAADAAKEVALVYRSRDVATGKWLTLETLFERAGWVAAMGTATLDVHSGRLLLTYYLACAEWAKTSDDPGPHVHTGAYLGVRRHGGKRWHHALLRAEANSHGAIASNHGSSQGIVLGTKPYKGRLLAPGRFQTRPGESPGTLKAHHYNCAMFSDDQGLTWQTGEPVQVGTGEGCLVELSDGRIYYNSRAYFMDGKRRTAWSCDGGQTFADFGIDEALTEPFNGGCNAAMAVYPARLSRGMDIILFCNPAAQGREQLTVRASFDGGLSWPVSELIHPGPSAYSSMTVGNDGVIYILFENGERHPYEKISLATVRLNWLSPPET